MKRMLSKFSNNKYWQYLDENRKYAPLIFFISGFIFDTLTLGRIDRLYDLTVLCLHMTSLTITLCLYNLAEDGRWEGTFLQRFQGYFPLAIQFFFGALSSAYVIYFSRSVSLSKTISFFVILVFLLIANEFLKKRISNKYLQFSVYFFISFTFFTFMIPVFIKVVSTATFIFSGLVSLICTCSLVIVLYKISPSTRKEIHLGKMISIVSLLYVTINLFYYFNLIPPVPLALDSGIVAHDVKKHESKYVVSYEANSWYVFWREHHLEFIYKEGEKVYIFTSIFAPTDIEKKILHRWFRYNSGDDEWEFVEDIVYDITGGRDDGYRGYTYKSNVQPGLWKVEVLTEEELILGVVDFEIVMDSLAKPRKIVEREF